MAFLHDDVFDDGLDAGFAAVGDRLDICSQEPSSYAEATSTYTLGNKTSLTITGPSNGDISGRKATVSAITDGTVTGTGTATHIAVVDVSETKLLATQSLATPEGVTASETFTLTAFDVEIPDAT